MLPHSGSHRYVVREHIIRSCTLLHLYSSHCEHLISVQISLHCRRSVFHRFQMQRRYYETPSTGNNRNLFHFALFLIKPIDIFPKASFRSINNYVIHAFRDLFRFQKRDSTGFIRTIIHFVSADSVISLYRFTVLD